MVDQDKQTVGRPKISDDDRFHYIGFDVFPGKPKDLFKSEAEKTAIVEAVKAKRDKGERIRDDCTLLTPRISKLEKLVLTIACVVVLVALAAPWYSAYNEIVEQPAAGTAGQVQEQNPTGEQGEEIITGLRVQKRTHREYQSLSGIGSLLDIGSVGGDMFSSGFVLILTAVIGAVMPLLGLALAIYTLLALYRSKGSPDEVAVRLKKQLRLNWLPVILFVFAFILSFFGSSYGFNAPSVFTSLGESYGPGVFLASLSWGILLEVGAFLLIALKAVEI
jgi:hypothetical protein